MRRPDPAGLADTSQGPLDITPKYEEQNFHPASHSFSLRQHRIGGFSASAEGDTKDSFDLADANHDGKLSREEAGDYLVYMVFVSRDKNHDGRLTQEEWAAGDRNQIAAFKLRDANEDGAVTMEEAIVFGRRGGGGVALMRRADKNRDGKLDRAELEPYGRQP